MNKCLHIVVVALICAAVLAGCSQKGNPVAPVESGAVSQIGNGTGAGLWGFYDVYIDIPTQTVTAVLNRQAMFTANVVNFINGKPASLSFHINGTHVGSVHVDVDIDVTITHPFPGMAHYDGYDVRGVFMGDGSASLAYNPDLKYAVPGTDQLMLADPVDGFGGPDGYTRWFNKPEFSGGGMPLFQYTQGKMASPGFDGTATLNPYKYFTDGLGAKDDLFPWLASHADQHGRFSSGASNTRNYYLRFPNSKGVKYGYAITANWKGVAPTDHPSNAPEVVACSVTDNSDVWFVNSSSNGGGIRLDLSLWDWDSAVSGGVMEDYKIFVESSVLTNPYSFDTSDMTPIGGEDHFSTYQVEIPADNITGSMGNQYWIIVEDQKNTYANDFGVSNLAQDDKLAALFRYDLTVGIQQGNQPPNCDLAVVTAMPVSGFGPQTVEFDASGSWDPEGKTLTYSWDFNDDGTFGDGINGGTDAHPIKVFTESNHTKVCVEVSDPDGGTASCCANVDITVAPSKNLPLRADKAATDLAVDPASGDLYVLYEDGQVWKYTEATQFSQTGATYIFTGQVVPFSGNAPLTNSRLDITATGYIIASSDSGICDDTHGWPAQVFDLSGAQIGSAPAPCTAGPIPDVVACKSGGSYAYSVFILAPYNSASNYQNNMYRKYPPFSGPWWTQNYGPGPFPSPQIGHDGLWLGYVKGAVSMTNDRWWVVKDPGSGSIQDYYASRWVQDTYFYYDYDNAWFGSGTQSDADDGWYNAKDITSDSSGRLYVLDQMSSGQGRIKLFQEGNPGTALTTHDAGDATSISESPLRIEGSDFVSPTLGNMIFVLHGNGIPSKLSIFFPAEFGW
jgi:hypothetical protein